ncbi:TetR/AcrR family transcriptional regulator [Planotetraspora kaengkrachanensis]|uniref:TetR family transcriptional regulator n=1 Tax=Planotetraspora kaengkrachanensis TaxID=575193 RepID=A0A8J3PTR7_9ACTN|nr:TetR/AcrR family transcriptional regulator [Planotetraspora kaengkrachanensis]GIG80886.1 TetR family transcriptional regulator [Planotetraspora kaengkrachanensis]
MPTPAPVDRARATQARREQIVQATIEVLAERGYAGTTFEAICGHAGLSSKRLISYHFATKDDLLADVLTKVLSDAAAYMHPRITAAEGPREKLAAYIRTNVEFITANPAHVRAVQQIVVNAVPVTEGSQDRALDLLAELFEQGQRAGEFRAFDAQLMSMAVRATMDTVAARLLTGLDPAVAAEELVTIFDLATRN